MDLTGGLECDNEVGGPGGSTRSVSPRDDGVHPDLDAGDRIQHIEPDLQLGSVPQQTAFPPSAF